MQQKIVWGSCNFQCTGNLPYYCFFLVTIPMEPFFWVIDQTFQQICPIALLFWWLLQQLLGLKFRTTLITLPYHFLVTPINSLLSVLQDAFSLTMQSLAIFWGKKSASLFFPWLFTISWNYLGDPTVRHQFEMENWMLRELLKYCIFV